MPLWKLNNLPKSSFRCLLADPPWSYNTWSDKGESRGAYQHYDVLKLGDLAKLPVRSLCDVDCWLFMWAVGPHLPDCIWLMREWGFSYSGIGLSWAKQNKSGDGWFAGMGYTTRHNVEVCLLGKRGKPARLSGGVRELIVAPRREHSRKPDEQYERIEQFCAGPRLELFARQKRPGWRAWGLEAGKFQWTGASSGRWHDASSSINC